MKITASILLCFFHSLAAPTSIPRGFGFLVLMFVVSVSPVLPVRVCVDRRFPVRTSLTLMRDAKGRSSRDSTVTLTVHLLR